MKLNEAQKKVLKALSTGAKETSNKTTKTTVSGAACWGLAKAGLVKLAEKKGVATRVATITPAGRKALKEADKPQAKKVAKKAA